MRRRLSLPPSGGDSVSKTVFTKVDYDLGTLVRSIRLGEIGLPDIQRPFVWKNAKVRDLFDSMYKGYPVGYLLFWQNALVEGTKHIGSEGKQKAPKLVIVDGQQRLTSLYAVIQGEPVLRENFDRERIEIAFNPLEERFEVADAAIRQDKAFLPNISLVWDANTDLFEVVDAYLGALGTSRKVSEDEVKRVRRAFARLQGLLSFPFTALELAADIDEEAVSDVFVRINSKGTPLNQADFILTLMSVFWDTGRADLEAFCRAARTPTKQGPSPYNHFIEPSPDQMLRVAVAVAFKRARLKFVYSILRGKDLETEQFSEERRIAQFARLQDAQARTLDIQHWHDFLLAVRMAGFRSSKMISSQNNLLYSYVLYLIGRTEYGVKEGELRATIARWFFMSAVTGRFTGSPESAMEFDLARLRDVKTAEQFVATLNGICEVTLTNDYLTVTLTNDLATSSSRSPSLFAFHAAQVLLEAPVLFSKHKIAELLDPSLNAPREAVERHHLFPKAYLAKRGFSGTRETNQIANFALVEWRDNGEIGDQPPAVYLPALTKDWTPDTLARMYRLHALPDGWAEMEYPDFLRERRELMAQVIAEGYRRLVEPAAAPAAAGFNLASLLNGGETGGVEFKATLRTNLHTGARDPKMELMVLKTIAGFLNSSGGTLAIGVMDDGAPAGLDADGFENEDRMALHLVNIVKSRLGSTALTQIHTHFDEHGEHRVMLVRCPASPIPVFVKDGEVERFYVRTGPSTTELTPSQTHEYLKQRFKA